MATVTRGERRAFGPIANDISGSATTFRQVGGEGVCRWKMLMNGMHLEGEWNCVEYVVIEPGASVGSHTHVRTEEIYYIISGRAIVTIDGVVLEVGAGDLITTPIGSEHAIANPYAEDMHFFVTEVFPGDGPAAAPARIHVPGLLIQGDGRREAQVDLVPYFTGPWQRLRLVEVPEGGRIDESSGPGLSRIVHVLDGDLAAHVDGRQYRGRAGFSVAVPPGYSCGIENVAPGPLRYIAVEVAA